MRGILKIEVPYDLESGEDVMDTILRDKKQFKEDPAAAVDFARMALEQGREVNIDVHVGK